jgi:nucleoside-specific outer membrane channel protein Tsx
MKKLLSVILCLGLIFSLVACKEDKNISSNKTDTQEQTKQKEYITLLYSMADGFNPYTIKTDVNR